MILWPRRQHQITPTFLEGTSGRYIKRDSPPVLPSSTAAYYHLNRQRGREKTPNGSNDSRRRRNQKHADSSESGTIVPIISGESDRRILMQTGSESRNDVLNSSLNIKKRLSNRRSYMSDVVVQNHQYRARGVGSVISLPGILTCDETPDSSSEVRPKSLSTVLNEHPDGYDEEPLPPLPPNWAMEMTANNQPYFVDHNNRRTHWIHPLVRELLPPGWTKIFDNERGVVYYSELECHCQYEHPGLLREDLVDVQRASSAAPSGKINGEQQQQQQQQLNILTEADIPEWLTIYSTASNGFDHMLQWQLFRLPQLQHYDSMLQKMYKQDGINLVIKYEKERMVIAAELMRREVASNSIGRVRIHYPDEEG